jgi:membrane associated rhomboid family serine protease
MTLSITLIIIIITVLVSIAAFMSDKVHDDFIFYPPAITYDKQWYRFLTCGLIHADFGHLIFNMFALYVFGIESNPRFENVEESFNHIFQEKGKLLYLLMYVTSLFACLLPTYLKHKEDKSYSSLGASGAVSAVIFAYIMLNPMAPLGLFFVPGFHLPAFVFGFLYIIISSYFDKRGGGNINHSAHIFGGLYGIAFMIVACYLFTEYKLLEQFVNEVRNYIGQYI